MTHTTPLKLWIITGFLLSVIVGVLHFQREKIRNFLFNKPIQIAFDHASPKEGDIKVVIICTSFGRDGLSDPPILTELARNNQEGLNYSFVKLVKSGGVLEDFTENSILIDEINKYDPAYVIVQESFSFFYLKENIKPFGFQKDFRLLHHLKAFLFDAEKLYTDDMKNTNRQFDPQFDTTKIEDNSKTNREVKPDISTLGKFFEKLNTKTVILPIPFPYLFEKNIDSLRKTDAYISLYDNVKSYNDFSYFEYNKTMLYKYYYDNAHLNNEGEKKYTDWFIKRLHKFHLSQIEENNK